MSCKELILSRLKEDHCIWHSSRSIELVGKQHGYLGGCATRRARELAECGRCYSMHRMQPVLHGGKVRKVKIVFYKHKSNDQPT